MTRSRRSFSRTVQALLAQLSAMLLFAGCNATGLVEPPTPALRTPPTPTSIAQLPPATATISEQPSPTPEIEPISTTRPTATLEQDNTAQPGPTETVLAGVPTPTILPEAERIRIFEEVWQTADDNYLYKDFHGANWQALHDKYLPLITNATSSDAFYNDISDMVDELKDDHSRFLSPADAREEDDLQSGNANYVGIGVLSSPEDTSLLLIFVFKGSPADRAGLKRRDRITAVDGIPLKDPRNEPSRIRGPRGSSVRLTVISPGQAPREVTVVRDTINGEIVPTGARLAARPDIGFLIIPDLWTDDMDGLVEQEMRKILSDPRPLTGLVMDLRGNGGGFRSVLESILGDFVSGDVGTFFNQKEEYPFTIGQRLLYDRLKDVPLVVLVDKGSESYTEILAAVLQEKGRATIVGVPTAGNTETIYRYDFEDRSRLWLAEESFKLNDGTNLEGTGVVPDITVQKDWTAYTDETDPYILEALKILKQ